MSGLRSPLPRREVIRFKLVLGYGPSSWMIAKEGLPWGGFSHAINLLADGTVIDARSDKQPCLTKDGKLDPVKRAGVQHRPDDYERWKRSVTIEIPVASGMAAKWEKWLHAQVGDDYDGAAIWGFIAGVRDHWRRHWICSALCLGSGREVGVFHSGHLRMLKDSDCSPDVLCWLASAGAKGEIVERYGV